MQANVVHPFAWISSTTWSAGRVSAAHERTLCTYDPSTCASATWRPCRTSAHDVDHPSRIREVSSSCIRRFGVPVGGGPVVIRWLWWGAVLVQSGDGGSSLSLGLGVMGVVVLKVDVALAYHVNHRWWCCWHIILLDMMGCSCKKTHHTKAPI